MYRNAKCTFTSDQKKYIHSKFVVSFGFYRINVVLVLWKVLTINVSFSHIVQFWPDNKTHFWVHYMVRHKSALSNNRLLCTTFIANVDRIKFTWNIRGGRRADMHRFCE